MIVCLTYAHGRFRGGNKASASHDSPCRADADRTPHAPHRPGSVSPEAESTLKLKSTRVHRPSTASANRPMPCKKRPAAASADDDHTKKMKRPAASPPSATPVLPPWKADPFMSMRSIRDEYSKIIGIDPSTPITVLGTTIATKGSRPLGRRAVLPPWLCLTGCLLVLQFVSDSLSALPGSWYKVRAGGGD
jgi:hypothetical protein